MSLIMLNMSPEKASPHSVNAADWTMYAERRVRPKRMISAIQKLIANISTRHHNMPARAVCQLKKT
jgi:hypothetical protein